MNNFNHTAKFITTENPVVSINLAQPRVYFRGINRIQINRFKAYNHIISNRLNDDWTITDDIKTANVVVDMQTHTQGINSMHMSVLAGTANLKPPILAAFKIIFDDNKLVQQLNHASKLLKQAHQNNKITAETSKVIMVCGLLNESLSLLCDLLNQKSQDAHFVPNVGLISSQNQLYRDQLLLIVDGEIEQSVLAFQALIQKKLNASIIIDQLTIAIIKSKDDSINDAIFDQVYNHTDDHTQVTLLNVQDEQDLDVFVAYF